MSKLLVVFGVSGNQGGSVANFVLNDHELSKEFKVRGVTRDLSKPTIQDLKSKGVEIVKGDVQDEESVKHALQGAHSVFLMTSSEYSMAAEGKQVEFNQGKRVADAAVQAGAQFIIFSTSSLVSKVSNGKLTKVYFYDVKYEIQEYIKTLPIGSAFINPGSFMQNYTAGAMKPRPVGDGTYVVANTLKAETEVPLIDVTDIGKWVGAILADPDKYDHKVLNASARLYTQTELVETLSKVTGKKVFHQQNPEDIHRNYLPPHAQEPYIEMLAYIRDFGYYGPNQKESVEWAVKQARGHPNDLEEFLKKNPMQLD